MSKKQLAHVTYLTHSNYDVHPDSDYMKVADYHKLLEAMEAGKVVQFNAYYYRSNPDDSSFYYQSDVTNTINPSKLYGLQMKLYECEIGKL